MSERSQRGKNLMKTAWSRYGKPPTLMNSRKFTGINTPEESYPQPLAETLTAGSFSGRNLSELRIEK